MLNARAIPNALNSVGDEDSDFLAEGNSRRRTGRELMLRLLSQA